MKVTSAFFDLLRREVRESAGQHENPLTNEDALARLHEMMEDRSPHIVRVLRDIQNGKIRYQEVDWKNEIEPLLRLFEYCPVYQYNSVWLWTFLSEIKDPSLRIDILHEIKAIAPKCYDAFLDASYLINDCDNLIHINMCVRNAALRNDIGWKHTWNDERKVLNDLVLIYSDKVVDPKLLIGIAERLRRTLADGATDELIAIMLSPRTFMDELTIDNIVEFVTNIYVAEGLRKLILDGEMEIIDIPSIKALNRKLVKACIDEYISARIKKIEIALNNDNSQIEEPTEIECLEHLLDQEKKIVAQWEEYGAETVSPLFDALWIPGKDCIAGIVKSFIPYLQNLIEKKKNEGVQKGGDIYNINVNGDYVNGDKHVDNQVDNVYGGIGINTTNK